MVYDFDSILKPRQTFNTSIIRIPNNYISDGLKPINTWTGNSSILRSGTVIIFIFEKPPKLAIYDNYYQEECSYPTISIFHN
jgi:hypothetical protein